jgi:segregation and condensation protein A
MQHSDKLSSLSLATPLDLEVFQGPLDLLLQLVERRKLEITEVSLAAVASQYLQAVRALPELDLELLSEFLSIGTRLLLLKSRALLPRPPVENEDEPVDDLATRLAEYRRFKEAAVALAARFEDGQQAFGHPARAESEALPRPLAPIETATLVRLWRSIARRQPAAVLEEPRLTPRVAVATRLAAIREQLAARGRVDWHQICGETIDELVATFLALLELVRRSEALVRQAHSFGPIELLAAEVNPEA